MGMKERLEQALLEKPGETKASLARAVGASKTAIGYWFDGTTEPTGERLIKACDFLGVRPEWLGTGTGPMRLRMDMNDEAHKAGIKKAVQQLAPDPIVEALAIIEAVTPARAALFRAQIMAALEDITQQQIKKDQQLAS